MDTLFQDIRYAARKLLRTPSFTAVAVATLALGIGATTAMFSIVNGVLIKPLPFRAPSELVKLGSLGKDGKITHLSPPDFIDYRDATRSFATIAPIQDGNSANLSVSGSDPKRLDAAAVGARFFDVLGINMELGRSFLAGEDAASAEKVVVLSDKLWRNEFGADPKTIGRAVSLNGESYRVVGVAPATLTYPAKPDIWMPFVFPSWMTDPDNRGAHFISAVARVNPGVSVEQARSEMFAIGERLRKQYPASNTNFGGTLQPLTESLVGDVRAALLTMFGAVVFVLGIACANVANLLLVRASGRGTEIAVRTALGAGRGRIVRQLVTESILLSLAGAAIGGVIAGWAIDAVVAYAPKGLPRLEDIVLNGRVLGFAVAISILTGLLFGLVPALHASAGDLSATLKEGGRGTSGNRAAGRTRGALVIAELALAVVLLVGAGLLVESFVKLMHVDPGFKADKVITFDVSLPQTKYPQDRDIRRFGQQAQEKLATIPGTQSAAVSFARPMESAGMRSGFDIIGRPAATPGNRTVADLRSASANFFSTVGIRLLRGRVFTKEEETFGPPTVVVVTEAFVKKFFPNEDPIGQVLKFGYTHDTSEAKNSSVDAGGRIIGVINDIHQQGLDHDAYPAAYVGWGTLGINDISFLVRSTADVSTVSAAIRERIRQIDPQMPVYGLRTMDDVVSESVSQPRFYMMLLTAFASLALLLAALGVYGVISYTVSQRTREMGIRIALGATQDRVVRLIVGRGIGLAAGGVALGLAGAFLLVRTIAALLHGVNANDLPTFATVGALLLGVAALASYLPARRAAKVDPVIAMRVE